MTGPVRRARRAQRFRGLALVVVAAALSMGPGGPRADTAPPAARVTERWLLLNIPAYRLDVIEDSTPILSYRVAVGMRGFATPVGTFAIHELIWNPTWIPPKAEWAKNDTVTPPGPANPLGKVKLRFDGLVFLHATPLASSIGHAASHACVRMRSRDAIALARDLQRRDSAANPNAVTDAAMDSILARWDITRALTLAAPVRFEIVYRLAEVRDSTLRLYPDIYRRDTLGHLTLALRALADAGLDTAAVDRVKLGLSARRARATAVSVPLRDLVPAGR